MTKPSVSHVSPADAKASAGWKGTLNDSRSRPRSNTSYACSSGGWNTSPLKCAPACRMPIGRRAVSSFRRSLSGSRSRSTRFASCSGGPLQERPALLRALPTSYNIVGSVYTPVLSIATGSTCCAFNQSLGRQQIGRHGGKRPHLALHRAILRGHEHARHHTLLMHIQSTAPRILHLHRGTSLPVPADLGLQHITTAGWLVRTTNKIPPRAHSPWRGGQQSPAPGRTTVSLLAGSLRAPARPTTSVSQPSAPVYCIFIGSADWSSHRTCCRRGW